jgi:PAS domain S-box-containing protein
MKNDSSPQGPEDLRKRAEESLKSEFDRPGDSWQEATDLIHELRVHQIELEMQNEELRRAQNEIEISRSRYADLYDFAPVGYLTMNQHGLIVDLNLTAARQLGIERKHLIDQHFQNFVFQPDKMEFLLYLKAIFYKKERQIAEIRLSPKGNEQFYARLESIYLEGDGGTGLCRTNLSDVSLRKLAEEALTESKQILRTTLDGLTAHIALLDEAGTILLVNAAWRDFARQNGLSADDVSEGKNYLHVCDRVTGPDMKEAIEFTVGIRRVLSGAEKHYMLEYRCHSPTEERWFVAHVTPFPGHGSHRVVVAHENITELRRAEVERARLEAENRQLQKAESLGRMAGAIAHLFNNQLTVVTGNLEMALNDLTGDAAIRENMVKALGAAHRSSEISRLMFAYLGQSEGVRQLLDLSEICRQSLPILQDAVPEGITLKTDLLSPGPIVRAHANLMHQVLTNLVVNAWESIEPGAGTVTLTTKIVPVSEILKSHLIPTGWRPTTDVFSCLEVADTGCGMAADDLDKIFDPFFTAKFIGRGLGLAVVLGIVKTWGGAISVESKRDQGSIFRIYLPLSSNRR